MAQIRQVVSETLQASIRRLLPSQQGFTEDLQATNVITPIIDLTPSAEGSTLPAYLQNAAAYGSNTYVGIGTSASRTNVVNSTGFWLIDAKISGQENNTAGNVAFFELYDGTTYKAFKYFHMFESSTNQTFFAQDEFVLFLGAGESIVCSTNAVGTANIQYRQIADVNGNLVDPAGFTSS